MTVTGGNYSNNGEEGIEDWAATNVVINGITVMDGERDDVGVARSALALSRTLIADHTPESPVAQQLVLHDCGFATSLGSCPIGADWWVRHDGDTVRLDGVVRYDTTSSTPSVSFPDAACIVPRAMYEAQVESLGAATLAFAAGAVKAFTDDFEQSEWVGWQDEVRQNLAVVSERRRSRLATG